MKIMISKTLIIIMLINMFIICSTYAESTDMQVYFDNEHISSNAEKIDDDYYLLNYHLTNGFNYRQSDGEILISRYGTELKITFGSDTVSINGQAQLFTKPVYRPNDENYISLRLITSVFGSNMNIDEVNRTIKIALNQKPVLPVIKTVKGSISLPNNEVAPSSGVVFKIKATRVDVYSNDNFKYVVIDSGKNSANFEMTIENDTDTYREYAFSYNLLDEYAFQKYTNTGYYSCNGTRSNRDKQSFVLLSENTNVDLNVIGKKSVSGTINRNGYIGDMYIGTREYSYYGMSWVNGSEFEILIPYDIWKLSLVYYLYETNLTNFLQNGYCGKKGTLPLPDDENYIDVSGGGLNNLQIDLLKGKIIKGTVNFPETLKDEAIGFPINAEINGGNWVGCWIDKPIGVTKVNYSITVPIVYTNKYVLCYNNNVYSGYISAEGKIVSNKTLAKEIDVTNGESFTQDIFVEQLKISGIVSLPNGELAPSGGMDVSLTLNNDFSTLINVTIPEGQNNALYDLPVSYNLLNQNVVDLNCSALEGIYLYERKISVTELFQGDLVGNFNITMTKNVALNVNIQLPNNNTAQSNITASISVIPIENTAYNLMETSSGTSSGGVSIPPPSSTPTPSGGGSSGISMPYVNSGVTSPVKVIFSGQSNYSFKIIVPEYFLTSGYILKYRLYDCNEYYMAGYYTATGTTSQIALADIVRNQGDFNITLLNKSTVSGTISKAINSSDLIRVDVNAIPTTNTINYENTQRYAISGNDAINYSLDIPADVPNFNVRYYIYDTPGSAVFKNIGYYNSSNENGITFNQTEAQVLSWNDNSNINFTLPLSSTDNYPLAIDQIYDANNNYFNIRNNVYGAQNFTIKVVNKMPQDAKGTIFVSRYDKNNKLIEVVSKETTLAKQALSDVVLKFGNDKIYETNKIKVIAWGAELLPLATPLEYNNPFIIVKVNDKPVVFDVEPTIINDRTMVPLRPIFEALGTQVTWDGVTNTVISSKENNFIALQIGNKKAFVNSQEVALDVAPQIVDGRTLIPLRFIAEAFGAYVQWDEATSTAIITTK